MEWNLRGTKIQFVVKTIKAKQKKNKTENENKKPKQKRNEKNPFPGFEPESLYSYIANTLTLRYYAKRIKNEW
jgi:hypothetical protein